MANWEEVKYMGGMKGEDENIDEGAPRWFKKQRSGCQTSKENGVCEE